MSASLEVFGDGTLRSEHFHVRPISFERHNGEYAVVIVRAGIPVTEKVGSGAFEREVEFWTHEIQISISPTGRSVQVYVDGKKAL